MEKSSNSATESNMKRHTGTDDSPAADSEARPQTVVVLGPERPKNLRPPMEVPTDPAGLFRRLEIDAKFSLYSLLHDLLVEVFTAGNAIFGRADEMENPRVGRWVDMDKERSSMLRGYGELEHVEIWPGNRSHFLSSYLRARYRDVDPSVAVEHIVTVKEATRWNKRERNLEKTTKKVPELRKAGQVIKQYERVNKEFRPRVRDYVDRWAVVFPEMVRESLNELPPEEHDIRLKELIAELKDFEIGTAEGKPLVDLLQSEMPGRQALHALTRARLAMLEALERILTEMRPAENGAAHRIVWKGTAGELYTLFDDLVGKGWVVVPRNRGQRSRAALARAIWTAFGFESSESITVAVAENYLKKGRKGNNDIRPSPRKGVSFGIKLNPSVPTEYDPDK